MREVEQSLSLIEQIRDRLPPGAVSRDVARAGSSREGLALVEAVAHLNCLLQRGLVLRSLGPTGAWEWERK